MHTAANYNMLLGSRILQGVGQAVLEFLVGYVLALSRIRTRSFDLSDSASIGDIYFVHEVRMR